MRQIHRVAVTLRRRKTGNACSMARSAGTLKLRRETLAFCRPAAARSAGPACCACSHGAKSGGSAAMHLSAQRGAPSRRIGSARRVRVAGELRQQRFGRERIGRPAFF
jgi:hypothetical protein